MTARFSLIRAMSKKAHAVWWGRVVAAAVMAVSLNIVLNTVGIAFVLTGMRTPENLLWQITLFTFTVGSASITAFITAFLFRSKSTTVTAALFAGPLPWMVERLVSSADFPTLGNLIVACMAAVGAWAGWKANEFNFGRIALFPLTWRAATVFLLLGACSVFERLQFSSTSPDGRFELRVWEFPSLPDSTVRVVIHEGSVRRYVFIDLTDRLPRGGEAAWSQDSTQVSVLVCDGLGVHIAKGFDLRRNAGIPYTEAEEHLRAEIIPLPAHRKRPGRLRRRCDRMAMSPLEPNRQSHKVACVA